MMKTENIVPGKERRGGTAPAPDRGEAASTRVAPPNPDGGALRSHLKFTWNQGNLDQAERKGPIRTRDAGRRL